MGWHSRIGKAGLAKQGRPASAARPRGKQNRTKRIRNKKKPVKLMFFFFCAPAAARRFNSPVVVVVAAVCGQTVLVFCAGEPWCLCFLVFSDFAVSKLGSDKKCKQGFWTKARPIFSMFFLFFMLFFFFFVFLCFLFFFVFMFFFVFIFFFVFFVVSLLFLCCFLRCQRRCPSAAQKNTLHQPQQVRERLHRVRKRCHRHQCHRHMR